MRVMRHDMGAEAALADIKKLIVVKPEALLYNENQK